MTQTGTGGSPARRRRAPRGQGERLREEILEAAQRLLLQTGDQEAVSIRAVADAVGVTPPSIYLHFADKLELIFAICEKHFTELDRVLQEAASGTEDPVESLRRRGRAYVQFGLDHPEEYRILFMTRPAASPPDWQAERLLDSASFHHLVETVQSALDAGAIRPAPAPLVAFGLWAGVHGLTSLFVAKPKMFAEEREVLIDYVLDTLIAGIAAQPASLASRSVTPAPPASAEPRRSAPARRHPPARRKASPQR